MAENNKFVKKYSIIDTKGTIIEAINDFFKEVLKKTDITGIMVPEELPIGKGYLYSIVTEVEKLDSANALAPIMPVNAAKAVSDYSRLKASEEKIVVVLRPCELRAVIELVKLNQVNLENLFLVGIDCPGTFSVQAYLNTDNSEKDDLNAKALVNVFDKLEDDPNLRSACSACEHFSADDIANVDLSIGLYGMEKNKKLLLDIRSEQAHSILSPLGLKLDGPDIDSRIKTRESAVAKLLKKRLTILEKVENETLDRLHGLKNFMTEFAACLNCHNCMEVCPICYCKECFFDSPTFDLESDKYIRIAKRKGAMRLPANMFLFHVTRFNHMVLSCIACGMCEQGCPVNIPLLSIYKMVGKRAQDVFDYVPGRSISEDIPILTFKEEELEPK